MLRESQYVILEPEDIESVENIELEEVSQSLSQKGAAIEQMLILNLTDKAADKLKENFQTEKMYLPVLMLHRILIQKELKWRESQMTGKR